MPPPPPPKEEEKIKERQFRILPLKNWPRQFRPREWKSAFCDPRCYCFYPPQSLYGEVQGLQELHTLRVTAGSLNSCGECEGGEDGITGQKNPISHLLWMLIVIERWSQSQAGCLDVALCKCSWILHHVSGSCLDPQRLCSPDPGARAFQTLKAVLAPWLHYKQPAPPERKRQAARGRGVFG